LVSSALALLLTVLLAQPTQPASLRIVVLEGEDAVNVVQQGSAVAPLIEVRDRNGLPVPGVAVTFSIQGGSVATFPGAVSTVTAVTNAAGQAAAAAVNPVAAGSFSIQVQAAFQGQTALATIAQSNVLTMAEAAAAAGGSTATSATTATAGGAGSGGVSSATLGIVGAAVAGGAVAATQLGRDDEPIAAAPATPITTRTLTSAVGFTNVHLISFPNSPSCTIDHGITGTLTLELTLTGDVATGTFRYTGTDAQIAATCQVSQFVSGGWGGSRMAGIVTGTRSALTARIATTNTFTDNVPAGSTNVVRTLAVLEGAYDGNVVTGTLTWEWASDISGTTTQTTRSRSVVPITLR